MKVLLAYGSAMARIDDMKLFGGVSGGRTGREVQEGWQELLEGQFWGTAEAHKAGWSMMLLTNPWLKPLVEVDCASGVKTFKTWKEYRDLLYDQCNEFDPDIVICGVAVSNFTPDWIVETRPEVSSMAPGFHRLQVDGKIDSRDTETLTIQLSRTPNIINWVRHHMREDAVLVGFKLTSHGDLKRLITHARHVLTKSQADFIVANDLKLGLIRKFFVTPTGMVEGTAEGIPLFAHAIAKAKQSGYFETHRRVDVEPDYKDIEKSKGVSAAWAKACDLWKALGSQMKPHGTLAVRIPDLGFVTTTRGKQIVGSTSGWPDPDQVPLTMVWDVDKEPGVVITGRQTYSSEKATLNAPLLHRIFANTPDFHVIIHLHKYLSSAFPTFPYVPPGTRAEVSLADKFENTFNIEGHGCVVSFSMTEDYGAILAWLEDPQHWR